MTKTLALALVFLVEACRGNASIPSAPTASAPNVPAEVPSPSASASAGIAPESADVRSHDGRLTVHFEESVEVATLTEAGAANASPLVDIHHLHVERPPAVRQTLPGYDPLLAFDATAAERADGFYGPEFSPDDKTLYFMSWAWGNSHAVYAIDIASKKIQFVAGANSYMVIVGCSDPTLNGLLLVYPHFASLHNVRFIDAPVVMDASGRALGFAGDDKRFLAKRCGIGVAPADPRPPTIPTHPLPDHPFRCGDDTIEYTVLEFLDGTRNAYVKGPYGNTWDDLVGNFRSGCPEVLK